jgi:hypothetical protein
MPRDGVVLLLPDGRDHTRLILALPWPWSATTLAWSYLHHPFQWGLQSDAVRLQVPARRRRFPASWLFDGGGGGRRWIPLFYSDVCVAVVRA